MLLLLLGIPSAAHASAADADAQVDAVLAPWEKSCPDQCREYSQKSLRNRCERHFSVPLPISEKQRNLLHTTKDKLRRVIGRLKQMDKSDSADALARANLLLAEMQLTELASRKIPRNLNFSSKNPRKRKRSEQEFKNFLEEGMKAAALTRELFTKALDAKRLSPTRRQQAIRGIAETHQLIGIQLALIEIPEDLKKGKMRRETTEAFCDALADNIEPLYRAAAESVSFCEEEEGADCAIPPRPTQ